MKCMLCNSEVEAKEDVLNDSVGKIPKFDTDEEALKEIIRLANDKRSHIMYTDAINWERVKMKAVKKIAKNLLEKRNK